MMLRKVIAVVGSTASGKTGAAVRLCERINGEAVSMDSMQIYQGMHIGTARTSAEETRDVPHHMLAVAPPDEAYSVARYVSTVLPIIDGIIARGRVPVLVGGTGLFLDGVRYEKTFGGGSANESLRSQLELLSNEELHEKLCVLDADTARLVHPANRRRVIRYIEIIMTSGKPPVRSDQRLRFDVLPIGIAMPKPELDKRIEMRAREMIRDGLVGEVEFLLRNGLSRDAQSMQAIGYKEIAAYLNGECTLAEATERIVVGTRQYAKRQTTWFKRTDGIMWLSACDTDSILEAATRFFLE